MANGLRSPKLYASNSLLIGRDDNHAVTFALAKTLQGFNTIKEIRMSYRFRMVSVPLGGTHGMQTGPEEP